MSKLTDIKHRIDELDGGGFQNLCDELLSCKGYGAGYSLGMMTGTDKTAKGNPDTYFRTNDGKYVLVMYTTQKQNVLEKIKADIGKCFDSNLTGLSPNDVAEVIYCHTCGRITAGEDKSLRELCGKYEAKLLLFGLDELGYELCYRYPHLAREHLGISADTGQITTPEMFVLTHDASRTSAPLDTIFMFRDAEMTEAKEKLDKSDVLLVSGPAGIGKTRFCLELIRQLSQESGLEPLCIKSNDLPLHEDLIAVLEPGKEYLVLIDDANELSELRIVLGYLLTDSQNPRRIRKIIMTVRDYARHNVLEAVLKTVKPEILKIGSMKNDELDKLMNSLFEIKNGLYLERIHEIANGNARLAVLAGKVASKEQTLLSISDATELYEYYYRSQICQITSSELGIRAMGIVAFFQRMGLEDLGVFDPVFFLAGISHDEFISEIHKLHAVELVDLAYERAVKISDQSFGNYLLKYVFVSGHIIPLSSMVVCSSKISMKRTVAACNVLFNLFTDEHTEKEVESELNKAWDILSEDSTRFYPFFKAFFMLRPTETLRILQEKIKAEKARTFDVSQVDPSEFKNGENLNDDILQMLSGFRHHQQLSTAIDLLMEYYQKRPDLYKQFYYAFIYEFGFDSMSQRCGFQAQRIVAEKLSDIIKADPSENNTALFIKIAENYLKLRNSSAEESSDTSFKVFTIVIPSNQYTLAYRAALLQTMVDLYECGKIRSEIEAVLMQYCRYGLSRENIEIVRQEWGYIEHFFELLSCENLNHCLIAEHISEIAKKAEIDTHAILEPFLTSWKYRISCALKIDYRERDKSDYRAPERRLLARVKDLIVDYDADDYQALFQVCREYLRTTDAQDWELRGGVEDIFNLTSDDSEMSAVVVLAYLEADTPFDVCPHKTFQSLFRKLGPDAFRELITSRSYTQQNVWLWYFHAEMPPKFISPFWGGELLRYLDSVPTTIPASPRRHLETLKKYEAVDNTVIQKAAKTILANYDKSPYLAELYFEPLLNVLSKDERDLMAKFMEDLPLLEEIYLKSVSYSEHSDFGGHLLKKIAEADNEFILRYLDAWLEKKVVLYIDEDSWAERMSFIWGDEKTYIDNIMAYYFAVSSEKKRKLSKIIGMLLMATKGKEAIQDDWIIFSIKRYSHNRDVLDVIFSAAEEYSPDRHREIIQAFLMHNCEYEDFEYLPLTSSHWGGSGSVIPSLQDKVDFLNSLLPLVGGSQFLQHRERIEKEITMWKELIKQEEIHELLDDFCV